MKNPKRTFLIGFIVGLLFFGWWFRGFLYINWRFGLFSWDSWAFLFHEIGAGWRVSSKGDWIFLISFILSFPLYIILWYWANKVKWESLFKKVPKFKQKIKKTPIKMMASPKTNEVEKPKLQKAPPISAQRPMAMPSFGLTMHTKPIQKEQPFQTEKPFAPQSQPDYSKFVDSPKATPSLTPDISAWESLAPDLRQMADTPLSEIQLPQNQSVDEDIDTILANMHWTRLPDIVLNKQNKLYDH